MTSLAAGGSNSTFIIGAACPHGNGLTVVDAYGDGCLATDANLGFYVEDTVVDRSGNIYLVSSASLNGGTFVRKIDAVTGVITRFAGGNAQGTSCSSPDLGVNGGGNRLGDGCPATSGWFEGSRSLAVDATYLYVGDGSASKIHRVSLSDYPLPGRPYAHELELVAGVSTTSSGNATGPQATTVISVPRGIAVDGHGDVFWGNASGIYMVDYSANPPQVRAVTSGRQGCQTSGQLTVTAATNALVNEANSLTFDQDGNLYFVDKGCYSVRKITPNPITGVVDGTGTFSTLVGNGVQGSSGGSWYNTLGTPAYIATLRGITTAGLDPTTWHSNSRNLYISTTNGLWFYDAASGWAHQIMKSSSTLGCATNQIAPYTGCPAPVATFSASSGGGRLAVDQYGNLYIADYGDNQITKLSVGTDFASTAPVVVSQSAVTQVALIHGSGNCSAITLSASSPFSLGTSTCSHYSAGDQGSDWVVPITFTPVQPGYQQGNLFGVGPLITLDGYGIASPATPVLTWNTPAAISYGTALSATQLNATASVPGSFVYSPAAGTVLNAGTPTLSVTFTPTDSINYTSASKTVPLTINKALLTVTANDISIPYGSPIPTLTASYSGFVNGDAISILLGTPLLTTTATQGSPAGTYPITSALGTLVATNYTFLFVNGTLTIPAAPTIASLSPNQGPAQNSDGSPSHLGVVIAGTGFGNANNTQVTIGGTPVTPILWGDPTGSICTSGPSGNGLTCITVQLPGNLSESPQFVVTVQGAGSSPAKIFTVKTAFGCSN
jgi:hypothetical protein